MLLLGIIIELNFDLPIIRLGNQVFLKLCEISNVCVELIYAIVV